MHSKRQIILSFSIKTYETRCRRVGHLALFEESGFLLVPIFLMD